MTTVSKSMKAIKPVVHISIKDRAFHVIPTERRKIDFLNIALKKEHAFIDNDSGEVLGLDDMYELFKGSFEEVLDEDN